MGLYHKPGDKYPRWTRPPHEFVEAKKYTKRKERDSRQQQARIEGSRRRRGKPLFRRSRSIPWYEAQSRLFCRTPVAQTFTKRTESTQLSDTHWIDGHRYAWGGDLGP